MSRPCRVLVADPHAATRLGVRLALEREDFVVVAEATTREEAVSAAERLRPDICLLDIDLDGGGIAAVREMSERVPGSAIVVLTLSGGRGDLIGAIRAGASGYLLKGMQTRDLARALRRVMAGDPAMAPTLVAHLVEEVQQRGRPQRVASARGAEVRLTPREAQVLDLLASDLTTEEIAVRLGISPVTVRRHVSGLLHKLDAPDRRAAVQALLRTARPRR
jgi:DNA-binding NarL/FixJ family response regulator